MFLLHLMFTYYWILGTVCSIRGGELIPFFFLFYSFLFGGGGWADIRCFRILYMYKYMYLCLCVSVCVYIWVYKYKCIYMQCVCVYIYIYIYINEYIEKYVLRSYKKVDNQTAAVSCKPCLGILFLLLPFIEESKAPLK